MLLSTVVACCTPAHEVTRPNPARIKVCIVSCSHHLDVLHYTKNCYAKFVLFFEIVTLCIHTVSGGSDHSTRKFVRHLLLPITVNKKCDFRVFFNGITSIQIRPKVVKLNHADRHGQTDRHGQPYMRSFCAQCVGLISNAIERLNTSQII
jgi:hypothetical protein